MTPRIAVLISGSGTTLQNLIDRIGDGRLDARIVHVVSSKSDVAGVQRARNASLRVTVAERKSFDTVEAFSAAVFEPCRAAHAEIVCLAGFLQLLRIPHDFAGRVLNIHPALLPAFGGKGMYGHHVHEAVLAAGVKDSGCTVHLVDDQYDHGAILLQARVSVLADDTPDRLAARVFEVECEAYPRAIQQLAQRLESASA